jgi:transposase
MRRYGLRDDQWNRIEDVLPGRKGHVGVTAKDNRLFVEAVLYRYRAGIPWRDLPERFGDPIKVHTRFSLRADAFEKGHVIFDEQWFHLPRDSAAEIFHDGSTDGRSEPVVLPVQP